MLKIHLGPWLGAVLVVALVGHEGATVTGEPRTGQRVGARSFAGSRAGDRRTVAGIELRWCPPGRFRMGSPPNEPQRLPDEQQVDVTLTKGFWMGTYEVTQAQWKRLVG